jgi:hypothetical protein
MIHNSTANKAGGLSAGHLLVHLATDLERALDQWFLRISSIKTVPTISGYENCHLSQLEIENTYCVAACLGPSLDRYAFMHEWKSLQVLTV